VVRADWEYYDGVIRPLLGSGHVELIGEIGDAEKPELLGNALALLFPIDWPEPFGLVMAEALACGTPVVARRRGSVPEVITHGVTGFVGETDDELARLCTLAHTIDRQVCRREAEARFSPSAMARGYERIYEAQLRERADASAGGEWQRVRSLTPVLSEGVGTMQGTLRAP
jgi:glycosyltransferase involved in cell wall biosynthesis